MNTTDPGEEKHVPDLLEVEQLVLAAAAVVWQEAQPHEVVEVGRRGGPVQRQAPATSHLSPHLTRAQAAPRHSAWERREDIEEEIYIEEKGQRSSLLFGGTEFIHFLALAVLHQDISKNRMNSSFSSYHPGAIQPFLLIILVQNS